VPGETVIMEAEYDCKTSCLWIIEKDL